MEIYLFEIIGTGMLILLGNGVVANVVLKGTKGNNAGWVAITLAWGLAVFVGVYIAAGVSGAHLNPAVTLGLAVAGKFDWGLLPGYWIAQVIGAMLGSLLVWLHHKPHYDITEDPDGILATFSTGPAIRKPFWNLVSEVIGTFALVFGVFYIAGGTMADEPVKLGALDALPVALLVVGIGLSLGGTTGYAINPARDLGPRIMHTILPIKNKRDSDWSYAWVPIVGPLLGGTIAAVIYLWIGV